MKFTPRLRMAVLCGLAMFLNSRVAGAAESNRQADVSARGATVMPFELKATTHLFSKTGAGGVQQVIAKAPRNSAQIRLVREHLREIATQFAAGNFSAPARIHGASMPGLLELRKAGPGKIGISYEDLPAGGQIRYSTASAPLVAALHQWFDAQLSDHGADAKAGTAHHGDMHN